MSLHKLLIPQGVRRRLRPHVQRALEVSGLIGFLHRREEQRLAGQRTAPYDDGLPLPPPELLVLVGGSPDPIWFSERGKVHAEYFRRLAGQHGVDLSQAKDVWDLGCGCGRIARWLAAEVIQAGGSFTGSDINRNLVAWTSGHLPGRYFQNRLAPPTELDAASKDLVYAYSVLTHLREGAVIAWLQEISRVLRPGGVALLTFHDEDYAEAWGPADALRNLGPSGFIVLNDALEGSNYLSSWTTRDHFRALAEPSFEVVQIVPGEKDQPTQAVAVLRRRAEAR